MLESWAIDISILNSMAAVRADCESVRPRGREGFPGVSWSLILTFTDSFLGDISYPFRSRSFYKENNPEIIKMSVWSNLLIILLR